MKISGIYKIINKANGKYYVGSSRDISTRWSTHKRALSKRCHRNLKLQCAWDKYGEDSFEFVMVENCSPDRVALLAAEQNHLNKARGDQSVCYNLSFLAGSVEFTEAVRKKLSEKSKNRKRRKGIPHSAETKMKMSKAQSGSRHSMFGKSPSEETRRKMSEAHLGKKNHFFGKTHTDKSKQAMRDANTNMTDADILYIRNFPRYRGSGVELSKKFNVTTPTVSNIRNGKSWAHLLCEA